MRISQKQRIFHRDLSVPWTASFPEPPSEAEKLARVDPSNPQCVLFRLVGCEEAKALLSPAIFVALGRYNHFCGGVAWLFDGPTSTGKTTVARCKAEMLGLPYVEINSAAITTILSLWKEIVRQLKPQGIDMVKIEGRDYTYKLPPVVIMIDEVHRLPKKVMDVLLKAVEPKDRRLFTENGEGVNTFNVCWMIGTDRTGSLPNAFHNRFCRIQMALYTRAQISLIVAKNNPDFSKEVCLLVAKYQRIPRKALEFGKLMRQHRAMHKSKPWAQVARDVAHAQGIDEYGMHKRHLAVLKVLGVGPCSGERLANHLQVDDDELTRRIMAEISGGAEDQPALVTRSSQGYVITPAGMEELDRRGIPHNRGKRMI